MLTDSSSLAGTLTRPTNFAGTLRSRIAEELRYRILYGELRAGDVLRIDELAEQFGVSRTPVREALFTLIDYGLVEMVAKRGVRIIGFTRAGLLDRYQVFGALSGIAARWATARAGAELPARLRALEDSRCTATTADQRAQATYRFHAEINRACGSPELIHHLRRASSSIPMDFEMRVPEQSPATDREHLDLIEAIERGDQDAAARIAEEHSAASGIRMVEMLQANDLLADD